MTTAVLENEQKSQWCAEGKTCFKSNSSWPPWLTFSYVSKDKYATTNSRTIFNIPIYETHWWVNFIFYILSWDTAVILREMLNLCKKAVLMWWRCYQTPLPKEFDATGNIALPNQSRIWCFSVPKRVTDVDLKQKIPIELLNVHF